MKTDELINMLGTNLEPVKGGEMRNALMIALAAGAAAAFSLLLVFGSLLSGMGIGPLSVHRVRVRWSIEAADASFFTLSKRKGLPHLSGSRRLRSSRFRTTTSYCGRGSREAGS
jgi:hypothetical protein